MDHIKNHMTEVISTVKVYFQLHWTKYNYSVGQVKGS